jgi:hypothetical protein
LLCLCDVWSETRADGYELYAMRSL